MQLYPWYIVASTYEEPDEGNQMLRDLVEIAQKARSKDFGLVSIGD